MPYKKFPTFQEIVPVYAVGVVILYTYTLIEFFYDFSNWALFIEVQDIAGLFAYALSGVFLESLIVIAILLFLNLILPKKILAGRFVLYGTIFTIAFLGTLLLRYYVGAGAWGFFAGTLLVFVLLGARFKIVRTVFETIADRCIIFLYVYLPLSLISILMITIRNIG